MFSTYGAGLKSISLPPTDGFCNYIYLCGEIKHENQARQVVDMSKSWHRGRVMLLICGSSHSSTSRHLLVPTVSYREHPLLVDEHAATEVVPVVEGGHVRTGVRLALLPADNPAIFAGNCRSCTQTETGEGNRKCDTLPSLVIFFFFLKCGIK